VFQNQKLIIIPVSQGKNAMRIVEAYLSAKFQKTFFFPSNFKNCCTLKSKDKSTFFGWWIMYRKNSLIALAPKNHPKQTSIPKLPKYLKALKKII